jgi:UDP-glucose 4-epimerase
VVVTGGAGFIGSHTVEALVALGSSVLVIDDFTHACGHDVPEPVELLRADCGSVEAAEAIMAFQPEAVLHLAAKGGVVRALRDPGQYVHQGLASTVALFNAAGLSGAHRIVTASSGGTIYGDASSFPTDENAPALPRSPYGASKRADEVFLGAFEILYGISGMPLRYANVYGPRQDGTGEAGVVAISCRRLTARQPPIIFGDGKQSRDFVFVGDVAAANVAALSSDRSGPVNIGTGVDPSVESIVLTLCELAGEERKLEHRPAREGEVRRTCLDATRAGEWLGWSARVSIDEGLSITKDYFDRHPLPALAGSD